MHTTKITRALAGFAPAGKLSHRWISGSRRCAISSPLAVGALLCSAATALWSQGTQTYTYSVLHTFTGASWAGPMGAIRRCDPRRGRQPLWDYLLLRLGGRWRGVQAGYGRP
jgi:hypothetical protein